MDRDGGSTTHSYTFTGIYNLYHTLFSTFFPIGCFLSAMHCQWWNTFMHQKKKHRYLMTAHNTVVRFSAQILSLDWMSWTSPRSSITLQECSLLWRFRCEYEPYHVSLRSSNIANYLESCPACDIEPWDIDYNHRHFSSFHHHPPLNAHTIFIITIIVFFFPACLVVRGLCLSHTS